MSGRWKYLMLAFAASTLVLAASAPEAQAQWRRGWVGSYGYGPVYGYGPAYGYGYRYYRRPYAYAPGYYGAPVVVRPRYRYHPYGWYGPATSNLRSGYTRVSPNYYGPY